MATQNELIEGEAAHAVELEHKFAAAAAALKDLQEQINSAWKNVESQMIDNNIKSYKGEWGSLTIAERLGWETTKDLPKKFYKKVVDTKKLSDTFRLEGEAPKGATPKYTKYLTKRIK